MSDNVTLGQYMVWIRSEGGTCSSGIGGDDAIGMVPVIKITAYNGRYVVHPSADQNEILSPSVLESYDRRLRVLSPFKHSRSM